MEELWDAIKNSFLSALKGSFKRTNMIVIDTGDKLEARKTETGIGEINTYFTPFKTSFGTLYLEWKLTNNTYPARRRRSRKAGNRAWRKGQPVSVYP